MKIEIPTENQKRTANIRSVIDCVRSTSVVCCSNGKSRTRICQIWRTRISKVGNLSEINLEYCVGTYLFIYLFLNRTTCPRPTKSATDIRDRFANYLVSPEGAFSWQMSKI
jgi:hypothetical protein